MKCQQSVKINIPGDTAGGLKLQRHRVGGITAAIPDIEVNSVAAGRHPFLRGVAKGQPANPSLTVGRYGLINRGETSPRE
jgi:hypothetical protein